MGDESTTGAMVAAEPRLRTAVDEGNSSAPPRTGETSSTSPTLGPTIALGAALAIGALFLVIPLLWQVMPTTPLPIGFLPTHQNAETLIFLVTFAFLVPGSVLASIRLSGRIMAGPNAASFSSLSALLSCGVASVLILTKISTELPWGGGPGTFAVAGLLWWVAAANLLARAARARRSRRLAAVAGSDTELWWLCAVLLVGVVLSFIHLASVTVPALVTGLVLSAVVLVLRERIHPQSASRRVGAALDVGIVLLLAFAIPNLVVFVTGASDFPTVFQTRIIQYHQDFFLGPANQVLAGDGMLVNVLSQYGVGSIYFLAGVFLVLPIGNGTLGLVEGVLSALMFIGTFATLRIAHASRLLAGSAMAFAVVVLVYGLEYPLGGLLQHGAIRYGIPVGVIVGAVAEARWPHLKRMTRGLQLFTIAVASIWALEAFMYTLITVVAIVAFHVATRPAGQRRREIVRWAVQIFGAIALGHVVLVIATLAGTGSFPDWGWYLHTLREFLAGKIGDLTYDFSSFSSGLLPGGGYLVSVIGVVTIMVRRRDLVDRQRTTMLAIVAMTAWGIALYSYLVNRSADHIVPYVCLPAVALAALWLTLLRRVGLGIKASSARAALAVVLVVASLWVSVVWSSVGTRYSQSALAYVIPGGDSLAQGLQRLIDRPVIRSASVEGERLLRRFMPGERRSIVLTGADLSIEILLRAERASSVPFGDPVEDSFVPDGHFARLARFVDGLAPGRRVLLDAAARSAFDRYRLQPRLDPLTDPGLPSVRSELESLQKWVLRRIGRRFDLHTVTRTASGFEVAELVRRPGNP